MILKIQQPLSTNDPNVPWLLYNKNRKYTFTIADKKIPSEIRQDVRSKGGKAYWDCSFIGALISFNNAVKTQDW